MGMGICVDEVLTKEGKAPDNDMVYHPPHYTQGDVECIDAIKASMEPSEYAGFLKGQVIKYMWRYEKKWNPSEDLDKAHFYLDKLREFTEKHPDIFRKEMNLKVGYDIGYNPDWTVLLRNCRFERGTGGE